VYFPKGGATGAEIPFELQYFYKSQTVSFAGDAFWHDALTSCYIFSTDPPPSIDKIIRIRLEMNAFDDDKVDLYDFCNRIVNYDRAIIFNTSNTETTREKTVFNDPLESIWKKCVFCLCGVPTIHRRIFNNVVVI
jgi:hypothetical protein